jgi:hypothetical protein
MASTPVATIDYHLPVIRSRQGFERLSAAYGAPITFAADEFSVTHDEPAAQHCCYGPTGNFQAFVRRVISVTVQVRLR